MAVAMRERRVVGISRADGSPVFAGEEHRAKGGMRRVIRHDMPRQEGVDNGRVVGVAGSGKVVREKPASSSTIAALGELDRKMYGAGRDGGGPCPESEKSATLDQLVNRACYYRRLLGISERSDLAALLELSGDALIVAGRHLARTEIARCRRRYAEGRAPAKPVWAARDELSGEGSATIRRLDGAAGEACLDEDDGLVDDWIDYVDEDAYFKRPARYSPTRREARWRSVDDKAPPLAALRVLSLLGTRPISSLRQRGGAVVPSHGYSWGQSLSHARISVCLPPGTRKNDVECLIEASRLTLRIRVDTKSPFARSRGMDCVDEYSCALFEKDALYDLVDKDNGSCWTLDYDYRVRKPGPLYDVVHPTLLVTLAKRRLRWWRRLCRGHPAIRPQNFQFMVDYERECDEIE